MSKRIICLLLCLSLFLSLSACGSEGGASSRDENKSAVEEALEAGISEAESGADTAEPNMEPEEIGDTAPDSGEGQETESGSETADGPGTGSDGETVSLDSVDVDLTAMSSTMVYSEVSSMMTDPDSFIGKVVKMAGAFAVYQDETSGNTYFACIVQDATQCCSNGIEFVLAGNHAYPEDYPELGSEITVTGVFDTYYEGPFYYCTLREAVFS